jgi:hypothetical protein
MLEASAAGYRGLLVHRDGEPLDWISFPTEAFFTLQERLAEHEAEGVAMPEGVERSELALRVLIVAELSRREGGLDAVGGSRRGL